MSVKADLMGHRIRSIQNDHFMGKALNELSAKHVKILFEHWVPVIRRGWKEASRAQREDCLAIETAFKVATGEPWEQ